MNKINHIRAERFLDNHYRVEGGRWGDLCVNLEHMELKYLDCDERKFRCNIADSFFGGLQLRRLNCTGGALRAVQTANTGWVTDPDEAIWLCLVLAGKLHIDSAKGSVCVSKGDLSVVDCARAYAIEVTSSSSDTLWVGVPRSLIERHFIDVEDLVGECIDGMEGQRQVVHQIMAAAFTDPPPMPDDAARRIVEGVFALLGMTLGSGQLSTGSARSRAACRTRAKRYIDGRIGDPELTVVQIARGLGVSVRYLNQLFAEESLTVSRWMWERRLLLSRRSLSELGNTTTVAEVAYAHGFKNASHFSRTFFARYGLRPNEVQKRASQSGANLPAGSIDCARTALEGGAAPVLKLIANKGVSLSLSDSRCQI